MIKKRFNKIKVYLSYEIFDNDNQKQLDVDRVVDLLNALYYENEQLKSENIELTVDNKELKFSNNELYQENEQLKKEIEELKWNLELER